MSETWEDQLMAIRTDLEDLVFACAMYYHPEILPDAVCAVGETPDETKVRAWVEDLPDTLTFSDFTDMLYQADQNDKKS